MTIIDGMLRNARKEANFIKRMSDEKRTTYLLQTIASHNASLLVPFIRIRRYDRYWREIHYTINNHIDPLRKSTTYNSRRNSDALMLLSPKERLFITKQFIATCDAKYLIPFITITAHDADYQHVQYTIHTHKKGA